MTNLTIRITPYIDVNYNDIVKKVLCCSILTTIIDLSFLVNNIVLMILMNFVYLM